MNTWTAPLLVAVMSIVLAAVISEPFAAVMGIVVAALGYSLNKAGSR